MTSKSSRNIFSRLVLASHYILGYSASEQPAEKTLHLRSASNWKHFDFISRQENTLVATQPPSRHLCAPVILSNAADRVLSLWLKHYEITKLRLYIDFCPIFFSPKHQSPTERGSLLLMSVRNYSLPCQSLLALLVPVTLPSITSPHTCARIIVIFKRIQSV